MGDVQVADVVLDSEALSVLADPTERGAARHRARVVLAAMAELHATVVIPAPVLAEVRRGRRASGIDRIVNDHRVVDTDREIAGRAGALLDQHGLGSSHAIDAFVAATALGQGTAVILTADVGDLERLVGPAPTVIVRPLT